MNRRQFMTGVSAVALARILPLPVEEELIGDMLTIHVDPEIIQILFAPISLSHIVGAPSWGCDGMDAAKIIPWSLAIPPEIQLSDCRRPEGE